MVWPSRGQQPTLTWKFNDGAVDSTTMRIGQLQLESLNHKITTPHPKGRRMNFWKSFKQPIDPSDPLPLGRSYCKQNLKYWLYEKLHIGRGVRESIRLQMWHFEVWIFWIGCLENFIKSTRKSWHGSDPPFWEMPGCWEFFYSNSSLRKPLSNSYQYSWYTMVYHGLLLGWIARLIDSWWSQ